MSSPASTAPNTRNQRLATEIIDDIAHRDPEAIWIEYPKSESSYDDGFVPITFRMLANAVNGLAWHLHQHVKAQCALETLAYFGPNDARYSLIAYACIKARFKVLFSSHRNSVSAHWHLISTLDCQTLVTTKPTPPMVREFLKSHEMHVVYLPSLEELLETNFDPFPFSKTFAQVHNDPFAVLHTSGSTGNPKPIIYTSEFITRNMNASQLPTPEAYTSIAKLLGEARMICLLPLFHTAGFFFATFNTIFLRTIVVFPLSKFPPTEDSLGAMLEKTQVDLALVPPSIITHLGQDADLLQAVSERLKKLAFAGGDPSTTIGNQVSRKMYLYSLYGSGECGAFPVLIPEDWHQNQALWSYVNIHADANVTFFERLPGSYEAVIKRDKSMEHVQSVFAQFPDIDEFRTHDLFAPHPTLANFWQHSGRIDDIILFSNGEKANPGSFESHVCSHSDVAGALVFGSARDEAGLLIESNKMPVRDRQQMVDSLWPTIEEANSLAPAFARIAPSHICFTSPEKPMARTGKGTVRRHETLRLYEGEIDDLYQGLKESTNASAADSGIEMGDTEQVCKAVRSAYTDVMKRDAPSDDANFFTLGMDSLQALRMARQLCKVTGVDSLQPSQVYKNPSIAQLAAKLTSSVACHKDAGDDNLSARTELQRTLDEYRSKIRDIVPTRSRHGENGTTGSSVLLTGTTGYVGSYILECLLAHPSSPKIICLNRSADAAKMQALPNKQRDASLTTKFPPGRVRFLAVDYTQGPKMGLSDAEFEDLLQQVTLVIHNAWAINFKLGLSTFKPVLDGLVNLVRLCTAAKHCPKLVYLSSVSSVMNLPGSIPEGLVESLEAPEMGYGESKFVAEHLLHEAHERHGLKTTIVRVTQVSGAAYTPGRWNERDWIPRLLLSSRYLGAVPEHLGIVDVVDWLPIDVVGKLVAAIALSREGSDDMDDADAADDDNGDDAGFRVYNAVNPATTAWAHLLPSVIAELEREGASDTSGGSNGGGSGSRKIQRVPPMEWVERLRRSAADFDGQDAKQVNGRNPALTLADFFAGIFQKKVTREWEIGPSAGVTKSLHELGAIRPEWMGCWTRQLVELV